MRFAVIRWFFCAGLFLFVAELNSQTTGARNGATAGATTDVHSGAGDNGSGYNGAGQSGSWKVLYEENFEDSGSLFKTGAPGWVTDTYQTTDEFSDGGSYFKRLGVTPPAAFRAEGPFGKGGWLSVAAYSRSNQTKLSDLFEVVPDPADAKNHVLKISSPKHTDGIVVRPTMALPKKYRVCLKVGFASFGDGKPGSEWLCGG